LQKQYEKKPDVGLWLSTPLDLVLRLGKGSIDLPQKRNKIYQSDKNYFIDRALVNIYI
jgi:hypothetical protein